MRRYFLRRAALALAIFFGLVVAASTLSISLLSSALGVTDQSGLIVPVAAIALALLFVIVGAAIRFLRRTAGPITDVMDATDRIAAGDLTVRVAERGPREVRQLARAFNSMAERLETDEQRRRELLADIAHELRTPLSVVQANTEGVLDGLYPADDAHLGRVIEETKVLSRLLDDLATLSTAEAGALALHRRLTSPDELVDDALATFAARAGDLGIRLTSDVAPGLPELDVDPVRISEVLTNLITNALRHAPAGGRVEIRARRASSRDAIEFTVADDGPGVPPELVGRMFDRFVRSADSGGAGLGLAIAKGLVEAHSGTIEATAGPTGGTRISFEIPLPA